MKEKNVEKCFKETQVSLQKVFCWLKGAVADFKLKRSVSLSQSSNSNNHTYAMQGNIQNILETKNTYTKQKGGKKNISFQQKPKTHEKLLTFSSVWYTLFLRLAFFRFTHKRNENREYKKDKTKLMWRRQQNHTSKHDHRSNRHTHTHNDTLTTKWMQ